MKVQFIRIIREKLNMTRYGLAKQLGVMPNQIQHYEEKGSGFKMEALCRLRQISGLTWNQLGKMLDDEFLEKK